MQNLLCMPSRASFMTGLYRRHFYAMVSGGGSGHRRPAGPVAARRPARAHAHRMVTKQGSYYGPGKEVLYDLGDQPYEVINRANEDPAMLQQMRERMLQRSLDASRSAQKVLWRF